MIKQTVNTDCFYDNSHKIKQLKGGRICLCLWLQLVQPMAVWVHVLLKNTAAGTCGRVGCSPVVDKKQGSDKEEKERYLNFKTRPETIFLWRPNLLKFPWSSEPPDGNQVSSTWDIADSNCYKGLSRCERMKKIIMTVCAISDKLTWAVTDTCEKQGGFKRGASRRHSKPGQPWLSPILMLLSWFSICFCPIPSQEKWSGPISLAQMWSTSWILLGLKLWALGRIPIRHMPPLL